MNACTHTHTHIVITLLRDVPAFVCPFPCQYEGYWWDSTATDLSERGTPPLPQTFTTPPQHCFYTFVGNVFKTFWNNHWLYFLSQNLDSALTLTYILLEPVSSSSSAVFANLLLQCRSRLVKVRERCSVHFYLQKLTASKVVKLCKYIIFPLKVITPKFLKPIF